METLNEILLNLSYLVKQYSFYFFSITGLFLITMIIYLIISRNKEKIKIKKIKSLLLRKPDKALDKLIDSNINIINYFTNQENLISSEYMSVMKYLSEAENVSKIYDMVMYPKDDKSRSMKIKTSIPIFAQLSTPQAIDYLITLLYEDEKEIIKMVLAELKNIKNDKVIYSLIEFIRYTSDNEILSSVIEALKTMGDEAINKIIPLIYKADPGTIICYLDIVDKYLSKEYYQVLVNLLDTDNPEVKIHVIQKLANYELKDDIINNIIKVLNDEHWGVKSQAIKLLGKKNIIQTAPDLARKLTDKSGIVRASATEALLNFGYEGIKYIFELAKDPEAPKEVKEALKKQDIAFIIEALENVYKDNKPRMERVK